MMVHAESVVPIAPGPQASGGEDWVMRLRSGEGDATEQWVRSRAGPLQRVAHRYLRDKATSEDVVREVLLHALQALSEGEADAVSWTWLRHHALDVALSRLRRRSSGPGSIEALLPRFRADGTHAEEPKAWRADARPRRDRSAFSKAVRGCIDGLPELHRTVLTLSDAERLDTGSIARHLAMSEALVRKSLHQARLALRRLLDPHMRSRATRAI